MGVVALLIALGPATASSGADTGSISGVVTNESGAGIADACVGALAEADFGEPAAEASTGDDGRYVLADLPAGRYRVGFFDCSSAPRYAGEWFDDKTDFPNADLVTVTAGQETSDVNAVLQLGGNIAGEVTDAVSSQPIELVCVAVVSEDARSLRGFAISDESGVYEVSALPAGRHRVLFFDCRDLFPFPTFDCEEEPAYAAEWYDNSRTLEGAAIVEVRAGERTEGVDAALEHAPRADLAIEKIEVERLSRFGADDGDASMGRRARVTIANLGQRLSNPNAALFVVLCGKTHGCRYLAVFELLDEALEPGESVERAYEWDASQAVGDVEVIAEIAGDRDADCSNNRKTVEDSWPVSGSGAGVVLP